MITLPIAPPPRMPLINEAITCRRCFRTWAVLRIEECDPPRAPRLTCIPSRQWPPNWVTPWCAACCPDPDSFNRGMSFEPFDIPRESSPPFAHLHERIIAATESLIHELGAYSSNLGAWLDDEQRLEIFGYDEQGCQAGTVAALHYGFLNGLAIAGGISVRSLIEIHRTHAAVLARDRDRAKERALEPREDDAP